MQFYQHTVMSALPLRYCVLLITGDEETFSFGNQAFLSFASTNTKEVVRFAYVYQRLQQPLCDILMQNKDSAQSQPQVHSHTLQLECSTRFCFEVLSFDSVDCAFIKNVLFKMNITGLSASCLKLSLDMYYCFKSFFCFYVFVCAGGDLGETQCCREGLV